MKLLFDNSLFVITGTSPYYLRSFNVSCCFFYLFTIDFQVSLRMTIISVVFAFEELIKGARLAGFYMWWLINSL